MNDLMRPALYKAFHRIIPTIKNRNKVSKWHDFVGPICETTCKFGRYKNYQRLNENNYVAISNVGAYGFVLSSNYNTRPLLAEIFVSKNKNKTIRKRQNLLELIKV